MKKYFFFLLLSLAGLTAKAQQQPSAVKLYDTAANPSADIKKAVAEAKKSHRNVLLQIGGNWCIWCTRFHQAVASSDTLSQLLDRHFVSVHVNYDEYNKNAPIWQTLGFPQRFGFPVFVILDDKGRQLHIQNSAYLESGKGYDNGKIAEFFSQWTPDAVTGKTLKR